MAANDDKRARHLRRLAGYHKSAAGRYGTAVDKADLSEYNELFRNYQQQHADFADELEAHATTLEGSQEEIEEVTLEGLYDDLERLESSVSETDLDAMIAETKRVEDELLEQYEDAMDLEWTPDLKDSIDEQFAALKRSRGELQQRR